MFAQKDFTNVFILWSHFQPYTWKEVRWVAGHWDARLGSRANCYSVQASPLLGPQVPHM